MNQKIIFSLLLIPCITRTMEDGWQLLANTKPKSKQTKRTVQEELIHISALTRPQASHLATGLDTVETLKAHIEHLQNAMKEKDALLLHAAFTVESLHKQYEEHYLLMEQCQEDLAHRDKLLAQLEAENQELLLHKAQSEVIIKKNKIEIAWLRQVNSNLETAIPLP